MLSDKLQVILTSGTRFYVSNKKPYGKMKGLRPYLVKVDSFNGSSNQAGRSMSLGGRQKEESSSICLAAFNGWAGLENLEARLFLIREVHESKGEV